MQSSAAGSAADKANAAQRDALAQQTAQLAPWTGTGGSANTATADLLGLNGPDAATTAMGFQASPGYAWSLDQGLRAVDAGAAAKGLLRSGATLKARNGHSALGLADQEFGQYYNNLFNLSKLGESAGAGTGDADVKTGQGIAGTDVSTGAQLSSIYGNEAKGHKHRRQYFVQQSAVSDLGEGFGHNEHTRSFGQSFHAIDLWRTESLRLIR